MSYKSDVAKMLLTGEWLPLSYAAGLIDRDNHTVMNWAKAGHVRVHEFGPKQTNLYYVADVLRMNETNPKIKERERKEDIRMQRSKWYSRLREFLLEARPMCYNFKECRQTADQLAHIVANTKINHVRYGWWAINHEMNVRTSCGKCNSKAMGLVRGDAERELHMKRIHEILKSQGADPWTGPIKK